MTNRYLEKFCQNLDHLDLVEEDSLLNIRNHLQTQITTEQEMLQENIEIIRTAGFVGLIYNERLQTARRIQILQGIIRFINSILRTNNPPTSPNNSQSSQDE